MIPFRRQGNALTWKLGHETVRIDPWGKDGVRLRATENACIRDDLPGALLPPLQEPAPQIEIGEQQALLRNGAMEVRVDDTSRILFQRAADHSVLLEEVYHNPKGPTLYPHGREFLSAGADLYRTEARFTAQSGERFYGLGQHRHGLLDQKGAEITLLQRNAEVCIPFAVSSRMYGFIWHTPSEGRVALGTNETHWVAESAYQLDYVVFTGDTYADLLARYADCTGHAPMMPAWAAGFWQCKLRYQNQEQLLNVAREYKRRGLPLSVIVVDFFHWSKNGDWDWDYACWPDPAAMIRELKSMDIELMVSIWPAITDRSRNFKAMDERGLLVRAERGIARWMPFVEVNEQGRMDIFYYDATNPDARAFLWDQVREHYYRKGCRVYWLDACEPEVLPIHHDNMRYQLGNGLSVGLLYPFAHQQAFYDGLRAEGENEIVMLSRSAWLGSQRWGTAVWSGDIPSTWDMLQRSVVAGLNIMMSGIPWWTTDIGGFYGGNISDPDFRELLIRWFQFGVFCPLCRLHGARDPFQWGPNGGTGADNEAWSFGEEAYGIIRELLFLRERLRPYILQQMRVAHECGTPPMRPLFFDFADDPRACDIRDEFLFGPDILVAPVLQRDVRQREVYLPNGAAWRDAWIGKTYKGGQTVTLDAPLDRIPLLLRGAADWPIAPKS